MSHTKTEIPATVTHLAPAVTVLICTRNRGDSIALTIRTILACDYPHFTLIIVDQSDDQMTAQTIATFRSDPRLRYIHTTTRGLGIARNIGLAASHDDLLIMTDDDCEVPTNWITAMLQPFQHYPNLGMVFCDVVAGPHDPNSGLIPVSINPKTILVENIAHWQTCDGVNLGIGASMAIRRSAALRIGGFDPRFGAGARFRSGEDLDFTLRVLMAGYQLYRPNQIRVIHHGFRTFQENRTLMRNNMFSIGAVYGHLIRHGYWVLLRYYAIMVVATILQPIYEHMLRRQLPPVLGRIIWLIRGTIEGLGLTPEATSPTSGLQGLP